VPPNVIIPFGVLRACRSCERTVPAGFPASSAISSQVSRHKLLALFDRAAARDFADVSSLRSRPSITRCYASRRSLAWDPGPGALPGSDWT
jgi:hypothetical protein